MQHRSLSDQRPTTVVIPEAGPECFEVSRLKVCGFRKTVLRKDRIGCLSAFVYRIRQTVRTFSLRCSQSANKPILYSKGPHNNVPLTRQPMHPPHNQQIIGDSAFASGNWPRHGAGRCIGGSVGSRKAFKYGFQHLGDLRASLLSRQSRLRGC